MVVILLIRPAPLPALTIATSVFFPTLTVDAVYSSDYPVGVFKPLPGIYAQVAEQYGMEAVLHVAGSAIDAFGARSYGDVPLCPCVSVP